MNRNSGDKLNNGIATEISFCVTNRQNTPVNRKYKHVGNLQEFAYHNIVDKNISHLFLQHEDFVRARPVLTDW